MLSDFAAKFQGQDSYELAGYVCDNPQGCDNQEIPEPQSLALIGLGLIGMYVARRRVGADK